MMYTRQHPSPRYAQYIQLCATMHADGHFSGIAVYRHQKALRGLVRKTGAKTLLDFGCGAGEQLRAANSESLYKKLGIFCESWADALGVDRITGYDPACEAYAKYPKGSYDGVYASDVMEHLPAEDVGWIVEELFLFATKFVFATVALVPAKKNLPNGENAHITLKPREWWLAHFEQAAAKYPAVRYVVKFEE